MPFGAHAGDLHLDFLLSLCTIIDSTAMTCDSEETCLCLVVVATSPFESEAQTIFLEAVGEYRPVKACENSLYIRPDISRAYPLYVI